MQDFEKLGVFYLGRPYDLANRRPKPGLMLYDSRDLLTHAVCLGMTGSGKTGLCVTILEEAAIDGIPVIAIDPKGDLSSLMLTFPNLAGEDFLPWIDEDEARRNGLSAQSHAEKQASFWRQGLSQWGQDGQRIARLREAADFSVYTPGSNAGIPVSILKSFDVPPPAILDSGDLLREKITNTVTSLLALLGVEADPLRSREHILLSTILSQSWQRGRGLDIASLIQQIQAPPMTHIGAFDLESFYPAKERFELAISLNNLVAAPGFDTWLSGEPLDVDRILYSPDGKPRVSIFSIAHLNDSERMFFVSLLLNETLSWMRAQSGTSSLRAVLYIDEIFGYCPPVANPPSKHPLLTLFKQARAFGLGVVLATQNPVDLDYKGLANAGTWLIGRLQTERDKARVLDGLEGAAATTGAKLDRQTIERTLSGLGNRVFLMHNVHEDAPEIFETRWALSYLRGPLTRTQIKTLMDARKDGGDVAASRSSAVAASTSPASASASARVAAVSPAPAVASAAPGGVRPSLPPAVAQYFVAGTVPRPEGYTLTYEPRVLGCGAVHFMDTKLRVDRTHEVKLLAPITSSAVPVDWSTSTGAEFSVDDLGKTPEDDAQYRALPPAASQPKSYEGWKKDFAAWLHANSKLDLLQSGRAGLTSQPGEDERQFRIRLTQKAHEERDRTAEDLRKKYAPKIAALEERVRRAEQAILREQQQVQDQQISSAIHVGATLLGAFMGRKAMSSATLGRASTAARSTTRAMKEQQDVARAQENLQALENQLNDLNSEFEFETSSVAHKFDPAAETFQVISLRPKKTHITVQLVALVWLPYWLKPNGETTPAWR